MCRNLVNINASNLEVHNDKIFNCLQLIIKLIIFLNTSENVYLKLFVNLHKYLTDFFNV